MLQDPGEVAPKENVCMDGRSEGRTYEAQTVVSNNNNRWISVVAIYYRSSTKTRRVVAKQNTEYRQSNIIIINCSTSTLGMTSRQRQPEIPLVDTESTRIQTETELECSPYFVTSLSPAQQQDLQQIGLLLPDGNKDLSNVQLLREKHALYLKQVWERPLKAPFVSLDSSRPWILYWCLHGYDLLLQRKNDKKSLVTPQQGSNMIATLQDCWQAYHTTDIPGIVRDDDPLYFQKHPEDADSVETQYYCGGFGGGPGQLAHAATTYAAVLALCILATDDFDHDNDDDHYSVVAQEMLATIRIPLYRWMASLQESHGGYRMHHDGEVDVRATYTIVCCARLLDMMPPHCVLRRRQVIDFCVSCQTYEGGMGGEPFSEAHGGYTFCGVAALQLMGALDQVDVHALLGWLARRQMGYEGGFSGRSNKLVDGCYSFWQGGAMAIASSCSMSSQNDSIHNDPWLKCHQSNRTDQESVPDAAISINNDTLPFPLLFDVAMLERYILLCAQEVTGGLRDKPSKPRDFYHTCYNLSGLSVAQHCSNKNKDTTYGDPEQTRLAPTHPCYNICIDRVAAMLAMKWSDFQGE
jgi:protein farnesyltransferase subunit beta